MTLPISHYFNIRSATYPSYSPNGKKLAFLSNITGLPQAWVMDSNGGWPDQLTFGTDRVVSISYSPVAEQLIFARDVGGNENKQLYLVQADGTGETRLTIDDGAMHNFGGWSPDGKIILFAANRRERGKFDVYVQPLNGDAQLIWQNESLGFVYPHGFSPDGKRVLVQFAYGGGNNDLYEIELATKQVRHLTPHTGTVKYEEPCYAPDGKTIYCLCDLDRDYTAVMQLDLTTLKVSPTTAPDHEIEYLTLSHSGDLLAYVANRDGANQLCLLNLKTQKTLQTKLPVGMINAASFETPAPTFSPDDTAICFAFATSTETANVWKWVWAAEAASPITRSSHAGLDTSQFIEPELIHYPTFDGKQIPAWWYRPKTNQPAPVILYVHGGPEGQHQPTFFAHFHFLMARGYAILAPNVRGSSGYGKTYVHLDDVEKRMDSVTDLAHAVYWLRTRPEVRGDKVAVFGRSYGGFMVLSAITTYPELWAAAVDIVGISNFVTFLEKTSAYRRSHREKEYGSLAHDREFLTRISPIHHVDKIRAPLFVAHGANDPRVPLNEAEQMVKAVQAKGVPVELAVYPDEGHAFAKLSTQLDVYPRIAEFLDKHLK